MSRELIEKLVDALEFEHQSAENWRDFRGMESAEEFKPLIAEARAALAAPEQSHDAWQPATMREGYQAVEDAMQSLAEQAQDLRMGYELPEDKPARIWIGSGDSV